MTRMIPFIQNSQPDLARTVSAVIDFDVTPNPPLHAHWHERGLYESAGFGFGGVIDHERPVLVVLNDPHSGRLSDPPNTVACRRDRVDATLRHFHCERA